MFIMFIYIFILCYDGALAGTTAFARRYALWCLKLYRNSSCTIMYIVKLLSL